MKKVVHLVFIIGILLGSYFLFHEHAATEARMPDEITELTLKEAFRAGLDYAKNNWNKDAELISITSVDSKTKTKGSKGVDGKRRFWNLQFYSPKANNGLLEAIKDGKVVDFTPTILKVKSQSTININNVDIDSPAILKKTKRHFSIQPGKNWAIGYHYVLRKSENIPLLCIVAHDTKGELTKVFYNATDGKLQSAIHKVPLGGGLQIVNKKGTKKFFVKTYITGLSPLGQKLMIWGYKHQTTGDFQPFVYEKNGVKFSRLKINNPVQTIWYLDKHQFYVVLNRSIKLFRNHQFKKQGPRLTNIVINTSQNKNGIAVLTGTKVLEYRKGIGKWLKLKCPNEAYKVFIDSDDQLYSFTQNRDIYLYKNGKWIKVNYPKEKIKGRPEAHLGSNFIFINPISVTFFNSSNQDIKTMNLQSRLKAFVYDPVSKSFFIQYSDGKLASIHKGGDGKWLIKSLNKQLKGYLTDAQSQKENLYLAVTPGFKWVPYKKSRGKIMK